MTVRPCFHPATFPPTKYRVFDPKTRDAAVRPIHLFHPTAADGSEGR